MLPHDVVDQFQAVTSELRKAQESLSDALQRAVRADRDYRLARARSYLKSEGKTVGEREAEVELLVDEDRLTAKLAEGQVEACKQRLLNLRQELSALTSVCYLVRSESELAR